MVTWKSLSRSASRGIKSMQQSKVEGDGHGLVVSPRLQPNRGTTLPRCPPDQGAIS